MLKRKMYQDLLDWRQNRGEECLLIKGARQTGKTYLVRRFGDQEYDSFIEINFLERPSHKEIFAGDLTAEEILKQITARIPNVRIIPGKTLLFLDEIQRCSRARTAMKFLAQNRNIDVIASGSLLGLHYGQDADEGVEEIESIPVGYERSLTMYSLDFEEFLWGLGYSDEAILMLRDYFEKEEKVPPELNDQYLNLFREYMVVGGMPEVVAQYAVNKDFGQVQNIQEKILSDYDDDISNHARIVEKPKVRNCYRTIPSQLARENKKFKYSAVEKKATSRKYADSIMWLVDANSINVSNNVHQPVIPLIGNRNDSEFKAYINDTGLLMAMYGMETKLALLTGKLTGNAKGGIFENAVSECLIKKGIPLFYYKNKANTQEIEFLIERNGEVTPIEVKAGNASTKSLNTFIEEKKPAIAYKIVDGNIGRSGTKLTIPHYMAMFVE